MLTRQTIEANRRLAALEDRLAEAQRALASAGPDGVNTPYWRGRVEMIERVIERIIEAG